ncbi:SAM-dependent methyltransferase [Paenibacillus sp. JGP012]|uniref:class I SAM-dependent methyltransferase n=1 Tax=Paenibacillus sp. JGP012 TaxID=2735914 RepID=UPI001616BC47|nr:class I SAM-dependent methyltransferase [Paenibacillus sp. JGP012]MBB6021632.1 SAM-dependent methyltransferase [Paenibacillus sp. JGP012]
MRKLNDMNFSEKENVDYWNQFYKNFNLVEESTFCKFVKALINDTEIKVLDVGCGSGRDAFSFARSGYEVIGIDRSEESIKFNNKIKEDFSEINDKISFHTIDISNKEEFSNYFTSFRKSSTNKNRKILVYLRFLLHSITEETEEKLLEVLSKNMIKGDVIAAEFRTIEDRDIDKHFQNHYRRFVIAEDLLGCLVEKYNFEKKYYKKGQGMSIYKSEDPYLARLVVQRR